MLERDGLRCTWQGPDGTRCNSRAWLEHDHAIPRGLGGSDHPENVRLYCRAHNRLAAEQAYGQSTITRIIALVRDRTGVELSFEVFIDDPTVLGVAEEIVRCRA